MTFLQTLQFKVSMFLSISEIYSIISMALQYTDDVINKCKHYIYFYICFYGFIFRVEKN